MRSTPATLALCIVVVTALHAGVCHGWRAAPIFTLDLAKPPAARWDGAVGLILSDNGGATWNESFHGFFEAANTSVFQHMTSQQRGDVIRKVQTQFPDAYAELQGIAAQFAAHGHPEVDMEYLSLWLFWHELYHASELDAVRDVQAMRACTGLLALPEDPNEAIVHGRNLDQSGWHGRNMTLQIHVINSAVSGSTLLYQAVDIYWFTTGFVTASAMGKVTLQENWRSADRNPPQTMAEIVDRIVNAPTVVPQVLMYRHIMDVVVANVTGAAAFVEAKNFLLTSLFAAPFYAIMSGVGRQGSVLSIAWNASLNVVADVNDQVYAATGRWYAVQTNYDRWMPDPADDPRRTRAEAALDSLQHADGATREGVWMTISTYPVHNGGTMYSLLMQVSRLTRGFIRRRMLPDPFLGIAYAYNP